MTNEASPTDATPTEPAEDTAELQIKELLTMLLGRPPFPPTIEAVANTLRIERTRAEQKGWDKALLWALGVICAHKRKDAIAIIKADIGPV